MDAYLDATYDLEDTCYAAAGRPRLVATVRHYRRAALRYVRVVVGTRPELEWRRRSGSYAAAARDGARTERFLPGADPAAAGALSQTDMAAGPPWPGEENDGAAVSRLT